MSPTTRSIRVAALATTGGALLAMGMVLAAPATGAPQAAVAGPNSSECINAKAVLSNAQTAQAAAQAVYNQAVKNRDDALDIYNAALADGNSANDAPALAKLNNAKDALLSTNLLLNERIKAVSAAQDKVDVACATVTPTTTPTPTTIPTTPPPVGIPAQFTTCAQAAQWGYANIPTTSRYYRLALDGDRDGCACETNGDDTRPMPSVVLPPTVITRPPVVLPGPVVQGPSTVVPGPVVQGSPQYVPGPTVVIPNTSSGVNTGDGSTPIN